MSTRPSKPLQPAKEERRALLVGYFTDAVEELLDAGESYSDLSVERLIKAVDVSRSTFYTYFDDKSALLQAMGENVTLDLAAAGASWFELPATATKPELADALRTLFHTYRRHQSVLRAITEAAAYDGRIRELYQALVDRAAVGLCAHIESDQRAGTVAGGLDPALTATWLVWMLERGLYQVVAPAEEAEVERLLSSLTDLVWRALYGCRG
jgi:AcrR family transcriptional regulator